MKDSAVGLKALIWNVEYIKYNTGQLEQRVKKE